MSDNWFQRLIPNPASRKDEPDPAYFRRLIPNPALTPTASLEEPPQEPPLDAWSASWETMKGAGRTGLAGITDALNWPEMTASLLKQAEGNEKEASRYKPQVPSYEDIYKEGDVLGSLGRAGQYAYEGFAENAATLGTNIAGAIAGGVAGSMVAPGVGTAVGTLAGAFAPGFLVNFGNNLRRQMQEQGVDFKETNSATAAATSVGQSILDALPIGRLGLGKMTYNSLAKNIGAKVLEGFGLEASTEMAQQALEILQANPEKLSEFGPEIKKELIEAGIKGGVVGGIMGGAAGAIRGKPATPATPTTPQEDELTQPPSPSEYLPPPREYVANGTGLPVENVPLGLPSGTGLPEFTRVPEWRPMGTGLPIEPDGEAPADMGFKPTADTGIAPSRVIEKNGQKVFDAIRQQLYDADVNPIQANAAAKMWRARYETLGTQLGVSPWDAFKASNVEIKGSRKQGPQITPTTDPETVLNQDETPIDENQVVLRSALTSAIGRVKMNQGTMQQWLNAFKKEGVKDEEIEWSGSQLKALGDGISPNQKFTRQEIAQVFKPYKLAVYEAKPHDQGKTAHYGQWTLGQFGADPQSNYREVVVSDEQLPKGTYQSSHFQMVPNPLGHYRTTDRTLSDGRKVLHGEEFQSDAHQAGRVRGYAGTQEEIDAANKRVNEIYNDFLRATREHYRRNYDSSNPWEGSPENLRLTALYAEATANRNRLVNGVARLPYQQSWPNMLFRHALADAINQDKDALTWNIGANMPEVEGWGSNADPKKIEAMQKFYDKRIVDYANKLGKPYGVKVEKTKVEGAPKLSIEWARSGNGVLISENGQRPVDYDPASIGEIFGQDVERAINTARDEGRHRGTFLRPEQTAEVWSLPINDTMREVMRASGLPLFQRAGSVPKGNISIMPDKSIIRIFKTGDVSTVMHESSHQWLSEMERYAPDNKNIAQDLTAFKAWAGLEPGDKITAKQHELWARGFEEWLATGKAPNKALKDLFEQFRQWLIGIYKRMQNIVAARPQEYRDLKLTKEMKAVYDRLVSIDGGNTEERQSTPREAEPTTGTFAQSGQQAGRIGSGINRLKQLYNDVFDPQSRVPEQRKYLGKRIEFRGADYAWDQTAKATTKLYEKLTPDQQEIVTQYYEGKRDITDVPQPLRAQTKAVQEMVMKLGQKLVDHGVMSQETYDANKGKYVPNLYMKHFLEGKGFVGGMKPNLSEVKKRKGLSEEEKVALGQIRHPGITMGVTLARLGRDVAALDFMNEISRNPEWFHPRSTIEWNGHRVTPEWLKAEAVDVRKRAVEIAKLDPDQATEMRRIADTMDQIGDAAIQDGDYDPSEWKQLPDTRQYGKLRGGWVRKQIANDIIGTTDFVDPQSWMARMLGDNNSMLIKGTQAWKAAKVVWNPASHGRNAVSNLIQMNIFGGVPLPKLFRYVGQAAREMKAGNGKAWDVAKQYGIPHGNMGEAEFRALATDVAKTMDGMSHKGPMMFLRIAKLFGDKAQKYYQGAESLFKTAIIAYELDQGTDPKEAALRADDALFDYNRVGPNIRYLRNSPLGAPFIVWQYKALPMLMKTMLNPKTMPRYLPYLALSYLVPSMVASMNNLEGDDPERLRKAMSQELRRRNSMYLLPWKDENNRWQFLDVGYFLPWQMPAEVIEALKRGDVGEALKATPLLSSPVASLLTAYKTGIDPFTNRPIADKRDPVEKQVMDVVKYLWDLTVPSVLGSYGLAGKAYDNLTGSGVNRYGEPPADWRQIAARGVGLNMYSVDPEAQRARNLNRMRHEIQDIRSRMTYSLKDQSLTPKQRQSMAEDFRDKIKSKTQELAKYSSESAMTPSLRAATRP